MTDLVVVQDSGSSYVVTETAAEVVVVEEAGSTVVVQETAPADLLEVQALGPQGPSGTIEVGVVTAGETGAAAAVTNVGTSTHAVFNFVLPKGNTGDVTPEALAAKNAAQAAATNAASSATAAASSATAAASSATSASTSASTATTKASQAGSSATAAAASASAADASASLAATKAADASNSATAAAGSVTSAASSATTATTKAAEASASASAASTSASTATSQAGIATTQAGNAASSAVAADASAATATTKASEAATSATAAATARTGAEAARDAALSALDSFDDRYLGVKSSDPTLDNDGNALVAGALYYNTGPISNGGGMRVYDASLGAWLPAYASLQGTLLKANNLSDLLDFPVARTNLGLGNVENKSSATIRSELTSSNVTTALGFTPYSNAGGQLFGDLEFSGSNRRITGDFTSANRVLVQTNSANGNTVFGLLPNGTSVNSQFHVWGASDVTNAPIGAFTINSSYVQIQSTAAGTGTIHPFRLLIGSTEVFRATTGYNVLIGTTTDDGVNKLQVNGGISATQFNGSAAGLTGIKTINGSSILGTGNLVLDAFPNQSGNAGKFLATNGTSAAWAAVPLPANATPTVSGLVLGRTDTGTYAPPTVVNYNGSVNETSNSLYADVSGDFLGDVGGVGTGLMSAASDGRIQVGMHLTVTCQYATTGAYVAVDCGTITNVNLTASSVTISFSNAIDWSPYLRASPFFQNKLLVQSFSMEGVVAENVTLGQNAGSGITTGGENVIIGAAAGGNVGAGRNNVVIGNASTASAQDVSNEVTLGNSLHTKTRLFGALAMGGSAPGSIGQVLVSQGSSSAPIWADAALTTLPSQSGNNGKFLTTNGTSATWSALPPTLPTQTGSGGKFLTTDGTTASWATLPFSPAAPASRGVVFASTDDATWVAPADYAFNDLVDFNGWQAGGWTIMAGWNHNTGGSDQTAINSIRTLISGNQIQVGQTLKIVIKRLSTGLLELVDLGSITELYQYGGLDIGFWIKTSNPSAFTGNFWSSLNGQGNIYEGSTSTLKIYSFIIGGTVGENALLGYLAGGGITTGGENVVAGANAGSTIGTGRNNVVIGNAAQASAANVSNEITLGNSLHTKTRLFGALAMGGSSVGASGQVLVSQGSGAAPTWVTPSWGVTSFNSRTGDITVGSSDVTAALGYTPPKLTTSEFAPTGASNGDIWWNSATGVLCVYYSDGTSDQWVEANGFTLSLIDVTNALNYTPEDSAKRNAANGYAGLDATGKVAAAQLPSYVDDVVEAANFAALPGTGETGKIYVTLDTNKTYRWSGSAYVEISASPGSTDAVTEGSLNQYFTSARARAAVSASGSLSYNSATGVFSYTAPTTLSAFTNDPGYITSSALSPYLLSATASSTYLPLAGGTLTGNLAFSGTSLRLTGDLTSATRLMVQTSSANSPTYFSLLPTGTSTNSQFHVFGASDPTNAPYGAFTINANYVQHQSTAAGTGTALPYRVLIGSTEVFRATTNYNFLIGTSTDNGTDKLQVNGTVSATGFTGNASSASKWATARTISHTGDITGSASVDGSTDVAIAMTLANTAVTAGTYTNATITVDSKGRVTSASSGSSGGGSYLPLSGGTMTGSVVGKTPSSQTGIAGVAAWNAPFYTGGNVGSSAGFLPAFGQISYYTSGYGSHMTLGSYRTASGWGGGPFISWGGNDNYATEYWLFNQGGTLTHSSGRTFLDSSNYSSYALPLSGGALTGAISIATAGSVSSTSHVIIKRSGQSTASFGSYAGLWRSSLEIWNNDSTKMLFLNSAENDFGYANIKSVNGGIQFGVGSNGGTVGMQIETSGVTNFPQGLQQGGNQVLHAGNYSGYALPLSGGTVSGNLGLGVAPDLRLSLNGDAQISGLLYMGGTAGSYNSWGSRDYTASGVRYFNASSYQWNNYGYGSTYTLVLDSTSLRYNGNTVLHTGNPQASTEWYHSGRDFVNGTLITTSIDYSVASGDPFVLEIRGNSYGQSIPFDIQLQGYIYNSTIINYGAYSTGPNFNIIAMNVGGALCFWFARQSYWQGFNVKCYTASGPRAVNKVTNITDVANPGGTKQVTYSPVQVIRSDNISNYALSASGGVMTGNLEVRGSITSSAQSTNYGIWSSGYGAAYKGFNLNWPHSGWICMYGDYTNALKINNATVGNVVNLIISGTLTQNSDERFKTNWRPVGENFVENLAAVKSGIYDRTDVIDTTQVGVSAQSLQAFMPQAVLESSGELAVAYGNAAMVSAVELAKRILILEARIQALESLQNAI